MDDPAHFLLDAVIVTLYLFLHMVLAVLAGKVRNHGDRFVGFRLGRHPRVVHDDFAVEDFLFHLLLETVADASHEHALGEVGYFRGRYQRVQLGADAGRCVLTGHVDGLALLEHLPEAFREVLGRFPQHLPGKDIADGILDDARLLFTVVAYQLAEILRAQADGHLVAAGRGYQGVEPFEIYRRNLVHQDGALKLSLTVHHLDDTGVVQPQGRRIDVLPVRVVAYAQYLWLIRVIDIQREVVPAHDPVERGADHARERDLGTCDLALELLHRPAFPGVHERREVVLQLPVRGQDGEYVRVGLVQQLDGVGEGTVLPVLVDFEIPYDGGKQYDRTFYEEVALFLYPGPIQIQHDHIRRFVGVGDVRHECRVDRVATVAVPRIVEVDYVELNVRLVLVLILEQMVIDDKAQVGKLEIIAVKRITFLYLLLDELVDDTVALPAAR